MNIETLAAPCPSTEEAGTRKDRVARRSVLISGALAVLAPILVAGCGSGGANNEEEILKGPRGTPSGIPNPPPDE